MKKFLALAVFLLNLLSLTEVSAQNMTNESMNDCDDDGYSYTTNLPCEGAVMCREKCPNCGAYFDCDEIETHKDICYYRCPWCDSLLSRDEQMSHDCRNNQNSNSQTTNGNAGEPYDLIPNNQVLPNVTIYGNYNPGSLWYLLETVGGGSVSGYNSSTNTSGQGTNTLHSANTSTSQSDSIGYHRCPCLMTERVKEILAGLEKHPLYNQDNGYPNLTEDLKRQIAFPEIIQQGNNGTCGPAILQKWLAENYPEQYADCVYHLANYGYYEPWGLELTTDEDEHNPVGMTTVDLLSENGDEAAQRKLNENGIQYTSVDAIIQASIQMWANTNTWTDKLLCFIGLKQPGYDPRLDYGDGGGMSYNEVNDFIIDNVADKSIISEKRNGMMTYDKIEEIIKGATGSDFDSYTVLAGVDIKSEGGEFYFGKGRGDHFVEITGLDSGKINFWSWGRQLKTSKYNCPLDQLIILKKSDYAKKERKERKSLTCNCADCYSDGCSVCLSK